MSRAATLSEKINARRSGMFRLDTTSDLPWHKCIIAFLGQGYQTANTYSHVDQYQTPHPRFIINSAPAREQIQSSFLNFGSLRNSAALSTYVRSYLMWDRWAGRNAIRFRGPSDDATEQRVIIDGWDGLAGTGAFSISMWLKASSGEFATTAADSTLIAWGDTTVTRGIARLYIEDANGTIYSRWQGAAQNTSVGIADGTWHHVLYVFPSGGNAWDGRFYIDGELDSQTDTGTNGAINLVTKTPPGGSGFAFGGEYSHASTKWEDSAYKGLMADPMLFTAELTAGHAKILADPTFHPIQPYSVRPLYGQSSSAAVDERRFPRGVRRGHLRGVST